MSSLSAARPRRARGSAIGVGESLLDIPSAGSMRRSLGLELIDRPHEPSLSDAAADLFVQAARQTHHR